MGVNKVIINGEVKINLSADTVEADKLIAGYTAHDSKGNQITGTNTFDADTSDATVSASEILSGKTAYKNGAKITGSMPNNEGISEDIDTVDESITVPLGFHDGSGKVSISAVEKAKIIPSNIKEGVQILGVTGIVEPSTAVTAETKEVTPSFVTQTVLPSEGKDYLSQVTVKPIPVTEVEDSSGGTTITVG